MGVTFSENQSGEIKSCSLSTEYLHSLVQVEADKFLTDGELFYFSARSGNCHVKGDRLYITDALKALCNNAFRFLKKGTVVSVSVTKRSDTLLIQIRNSSNDATALELSSSKAFIQSGNGKKAVVYPGMGLEIAKQALVYCGGELNIILQNDPKDILVEVILKLAGQQN